MSRQYITGSGFSLERLTEHVPQDGRFYLIQDGEVASVFDSQQEAQQAYHELCVAYWSRMLRSMDMDARIRAARGLLRRDRKHRAALETLATHGDPKERAYAAESLKRIARQEAIGTA
ncbi:MAG: hypothetical protein HY321_01155 [Armatimonadetes bacterium]|nr:hypothetical protein [Armatimonadota bacterium]